MQHPRMPPVPGHARAPPEEPAPRGLPWRTPPIPKDEPASDPRERRAGQIPPSTITRPVLRMTNLPGPATASKNRSKVPQHHSSRSTVPPRGPRVTAGAHLGLLPRKVALRRRQLRNASATLDNAQTAVVDPSGTGVVAIEVPTMVLLHLPAATGGDHNRKNGGSRQHGVPRTEAPPCRSRLSAAACCARSGDD